MKILLFSLVLYSIMFAQTDSTNYYDDILITQPPFDKMPEIIGGLDSLYLRLNYPADALKNKIEGKVYVIIEIDSSGIPHHPEVIKGIGYGCNEEAVRLVMSSKYTPAYQHKKPVKCKCALPIDFKLPKKDLNKEK